MTEKFYRFNFYGGENFILEEFNVIRHTPCGVVISVWGQKKFINTSARKQYAYGTIQAAKESFEARKVRQIAILSAQLDGAKEGLAWSKSSGKYIKYAEYIPLEY